MRKWAGAFAPPSLMAAVVGAHACDVPAHTCTPTHVHTHAHAVQTHTCLCTHAHARPRSAHTHAHTPQTQHFGACRVSLEDFGDSRCRKDSAHPSAQRTQSRGGLPLRGRRVLISLMGNREPGGGALLSPGSHHSQPDPSPDGPSSGTENTWAGLFPYQGSCVM